MVPKCDNIFISNYFMLRQIQMPTHYSGTPKTVRALDTFIKFTRAANAFEGRLYQQEELEGLTSSQFGVLETLFHLGPLCQGELSAKLLRSTGNMTLVLDNLEKRNLVIRERLKEDRRMVLIHLTPEGSSIIEKVFPFMAERIEKEFDVLTQEEQETLGKLCKILGKGKRK
jgi:MarR family 2-MHQ and catechol resistance regulon transcriptional repressor